MQAILILAHTAPDQVIRLARLLRPVFRVYVHFDAKCPLSEAQQKEMEREGILWFSRYRVNWGGFSLVRATAFLFQEALKDEDNRYFHVISGQDWPVCSPREIYDFYENRNEIFMECYAAKGIKKSMEPIVLWQKLYFPYEKIQRRTTFGKLLHRILLPAEALCGVNKFKRYGFSGELMHGANWQDLPRDAVEYLVRCFASDPRMKIFETGFCSDEFWAQTLLWHSPFRDRIVSQSRRFVLWEKRHNSYPAILEEGDLERMDPSLHHFCRKVVPGISDGLTARLEQRFSEKPRKE